MATSLCQYFGKCAGCSFQHVDYTTQIDNKRKQLDNAINFNDINIFSDEEYHYRNRMDFLFNQRGIGLREKGNPKNIINIESCQIANEKINKLLKEANDFFKNNDSFDEKRKTGAFRMAIIRATSSDSAVIFVLNEDSSKLKEAIEKIKKFSKITASNNILVAYKDMESESMTEDDYFVVKGDDFLKERMLGHEFIFSSIGFFQNNTQMAEKMISYSNELLKKYGAKESTLLDLYGGVGTFGIINSGLFKKVTIVESFNLSINSANENIKNNNIGNAEAIVLDAKNLNKLTLKNPLFVITDPPRSGMDQKTIQELNALKPVAIFYVSCNVEQLGKDILKFKNYVVKSAALFDLFPQTPHIEAVVELIEKSFIT